MALDFPNSPAVDDQFAANGKTWVWNGSTWKTLRTTTATAVLAYQPSAPTSDLTAGTLWVDSDDTSQIPESSNLSLATFYLMGA